MCCPPSCASRLRNQFASQYCSRHRLSCGSGANNGTSPQLSGSPPNLPALSRRRNWKLVLFVPAEDELAHKTSQPLGRRRSLWFSFIRHNGSPTKNSWLAKTKSRSGDFMQNGSIMRSTRLRGPDVWEFRWREAGADGKRKHRRMVIGSIAQFSDKSSALLEVGALLWKINLNHPHLSPRAVTV